MRPPPTRTAGRPSRAPFRSLPTRTRDWRSGPRGRWGRWGRWAGARRRTCGARRWDAAAGSGCQLSGRRQRRLPGCPGGWRRRRGWGRAALRPRRRAARAPSGRVRQQGDRGARKQGRERQARSPPRPQPRIPRRPPGVQAVSPVGREARGAGLGRGPGVVHPHNPAAWVTSPRGGRGVPEPARRIRRLRAGPRRPRVLLRVRPRPPVRAAPRGARLVEWARVVRRAGRAATSALGPPRHRSAAPLPGPVHRPPPPAGRFRRLRLACGRREAALPGPRPRVRPARRRPLPPRPRRPSAGPPRPRPTPPSLPRPPPSPTPPPPSAGPPASPPSASPFSSSRRSLRWPGLIRRGFSTSP